MIGAAAAWWLVLFEPIVLPVQRMQVEPIRVIAMLPAENESDCKTLEQQARGSGGPMRFWACVRDPRMTERNN